MNTLGVDELIRLEQDNTNGTFLQGIDVDNYLEKVRRRAEFVVHYENGLCVGFIAFYANDESRKLGFITLALVHDEYRGSGIAQALLSYVIVLMRRRRFEVCELEVRKENRVAIAFYKRAGFTIVKEKGKKSLMRLTLMECKRSV